DPAFELAPIGHLIRWPIIVQRWGGFDGVREPRPAGLAAYLAESLPLGARPVCAQHGGLLLGIGRRPVLQLQHAVQCRQPLGSAAADPARAQPAAESGGAV